MGLTVNSILASDLFCSAAVLAGSNGLKREVRAVVVAEIPDIGNWMEPQCFVHCVGWFLRPVDGNPLPVDDMKKWIRSLYDNGASCLAIKLNRYIKEIPSEIKAMMNELEFPLIQLPENLAQSEVTGCVQNLIIADQTANKTRNYAAYMDICRLMAGAHTLSEIALKISSFLWGNPVLIEDANFAYLASCNCGNADYDVLFQSMLREENIDLIRKSFVKQGVPAIVKLQVGTESFFQKTWPITTKEKVVGYFSVVDCNTLYENDLELVEICLGLLAIDLNYHDYVKFQLKERKRLFVESLVEGNSGEENVINLGKFFGFNLEKEHTAIVINVQVPDSKVSQQTGDTVYREYLLRYLEQDIEEFLRKHRLNFFLGAYHFTDFAILLATSGLERLDIQKLFIELYEEVIKKRKTFALGIGIGSKAEGIHQSRKSIGEAAKLAQLIKKLKLKERVLLTGALNEFGVLADLLSNIENPNDFCQRILGPIIIKDVKNKTNYLDTLEAYIESDCSFINTSKASYLHVNTVKYRIKRITEILNLDLKNLSNRNLIWLTLKIYRFTHR